MAAVDNIPAGTAEDLLSEEAATDGLSAMRWEFNGEVHHLSFSADSVAGDGMVTGRLVAVPVAAETELLLDAHARRDVVAATYWSFVVRDQVRHLREFIAVYREVDASRYAAAI